jgi:CBS domain-containing protein
MTHSLVGRRFGVSMKGISLFMFGGVAQMEDESRTPRGEFFMAIAGPLASFVIAGVLYLVFTALKAVEAPRLASGVIGYLSFINVVLAIFNLLPAFPLDGGRVLRSALWAWKKDLKWATHIASDIGAGFGLVLIIMGILAVLGGQLIGGLWWCLIGMFLRGISHGSYRQVVMKQTLEGEPVRRFMKEEPVTVDPDISVDELVNNYIYEHHFKMFPVLQDKQVKGCVSTQQVKEVPRAEWSNRKVSEITSDCSKDNTIAPDADATEALATMNRTGNSRLMVVEDGKLLGIIALKDMLKFLSLKLDLEGDKSEAEQIKRQIGGE